MNSRSETITTPKPCSTGGFWGICPMPRWRSHLHPQRQRYQSAWHDIYKCMAFNSPLIRIFRNFENLVLTRFPPSRILFSDSTLLASRTRVNRGPWPPSDPSIQPHFETRPGASTQHCNRSLVQIHPRPEESIKGVTKSPPENIRWVARSRRGTVPLATGPLGTHAKQRYLMGNKRHFLC